MRLVPLLALLAVTLAAGPARAQAPALRRTLGAELPAYMVPSAIVVLDRLPRTPNGKLDRRALPAPDPAGPAPRAAWAPPETLFEQQLAAVWADVLDVPRVGAAELSALLGGLP
jgi:hypothetical protein